MIYGISYKSKDFMLSSSKAIPNKLDAHIHKYYEFLYFINGDGTYVINGKSCPISHGDILIAPPDVVHAISFSSNKEYARVFIQLSPAFLSTIPRTLVRNINSRLKNNGFIIKAATAEQFDLYRFFDKGASILSDRCEKNEYMARLLFGEFAVAINEALDTITGSAAIHTDNTMISRIKQYLDEFYTENINLDEISSKLFTSKYHICHVFKDETGITVADYIALKRIGAVRESITKGGSINKVYRKFGFHDYSTFYRTVKKYTGMNPTDFFK